MPPLKTIVYRGGVVSFRIPATWQEEYEPSGGCMFYAPGEHTGTLRLNITTAHIPDGSPLFPVDACRVLKDFADEHGVEVQSLGVKLAVVRFDLSKVDQGHQIVIRNWQIAQAVSAADLRIALFSYTLLASQFGKTGSQDELSLLERELTAAKFATAVGEVSKPAIHPKPWWQFGRGR